MNILRSNGFYFAKVESQFKNNDNVIIETMSNMLNNNSEEYKALYQNQLK